MSKWGLIRISKCVDSKLRVQKSPKIALQIQKSVLEVQFLPYAYAPNPIFRFGVLDIIYSIIVIMADDKI